MFMHAKNGAVSLKDDTMHYVRFGRGSKNLIMLPGLGDGLTTVKGTALAMACMYRAYAKDYTVYMFSRRNHLREGSSTRDMAFDLKQAMDILGIDKADLVGVSMGGMIAQHFAADYPGHVGKLVLAVTASSPTAPMTRSISEWISLARSGDHRALMDSNVRCMYSSAYYRRNKWLIPVMGILTKPKSYDRFFIQAQACLNHDASDRLAEILSPTLIIAGGQDLVLGADASAELTAAIPGAKLKLYPEWGHALYDEAKDLHQEVLSFLTNE
ncbi:MAG: alpha/beta hydrolase [Clostridia bacterium]|nr:alpha/beta hydrolase [Clostridia bacterium]